MTTSPSRGARRKRPTSRPLTNDNAMRYLARVFECQPHVRLTFVRLDELEKYEVTTLAQLRALIPLDFAAKYPELFDREAECLVLDGLIIDAMLIADPVRYFAAVYDGSWNAASTAQLEIFDRLKMDVRPLLAVYGIETFGDGYEWREGLDTSATPFLRQAVRQRRETSGTTSAPQHVAWALMDVHAMPDQCLIAKVVTGVLTYLQEQGFALGELLTPNGLAALDVITLRTTVDGKPAVPSVHASQIAAWGGFALDVVGEHLACSRLARALCEADQTLALNAARP